MRGRNLLALALLSLLCLMCVSYPALAWGPAGHAVIGMGVAQQQGLVVPRYVLLQAIYGTSGPDFAWGATEPLQSALGVATHDSPGYREPWDRARTLPELAFAWGWLTHNQIWGADHYAHIESPLTAGALGYVEDRATLLAAAQGLDVGAAHNFVEVAIDLMLDHEHPEYGLGGLISSAASSRDARLPGLLVRSYADVPGANWLTIRNLEHEFRTGMIVYGQALALPSGADDAAFALGLALLSGINANQASACLAAAKALCREPRADYRAAITSTIARVSAAPWPALPFGLSLGPTWGGP